MKLLRTRKRREQREGTLVRFTRGSRPYVVEASYAEDECHAGFDTLNLPTLMA